MSSFERSSLEFTDDEISQIARIQHVSEEDIRRIAADKSLIRKIMEEPPGYTKIEAMLYLSDMDKVVIE